MPALGGVALWVRAVPACTRVYGRRTSRRRQGPAQGGRRRLPGGGAWLALPLLALAGVAYWNGALLDPLQFRGFPDYVTQLGGARRLLAGELPYNPDIRVWTDVNLPPVTLLLLFAPFTFFSDLGGKLAYFLLNQATFLAGLGVLLVVARPPARVIDPLLVGQRGGGSGHDLRALARLAAPGAAERGRLLAPGAVPRRRCWRAGTGWRGRRWRGP